MLQEITTKKFKKDVKKVNSQGKDLDKLKTVVDTLKNGETLEEKYKDHNLQGKYSGCRECHILPDWLLIYRTDTINLYLLRTGSHTELFEDYSEIAMLNKELDKLLD